MKRLKKTEFLIINQSKFGDPGSHWLVLSRDTTGTYEIFDSLGVNRTKQKLLQKHLPKKFCVTYNVQPFQVKSSTSCGLFCIFYIVQKHYNNDSSMQDILSTIFSMDLHKNESKVATFIKG